jgi:hypothetical protein
MARLIKVDGTETVLLPKHGMRWTLKELQDAVGGYIELMPDMPPTFRMVFDEEGRQKQLPVNAKATELLHVVMAAQLGIAVQDLPKEVGGKQVNARRVPLRVGQRAWASSYAERSIPSIAAPQPMK